MAKAVYNSPLFHADDANGLPLVGGLVHTYVSETTTPAATYQDDAGSTPNANPVVLNSRGEAVIFLTPGTKYTFYVTDAGGTEIYTIDGISSPLGADVLADYAPLNSPQFTGVPTAPNPSSSDDSTKIATTHYVTSAVSTASASLTAQIAKSGGACRLAVSAGSVVLSRRNGKLLAINGSMQEVPSAGVTLSSSGLINGTTYYVYAYMASSTMTLEASTTGYAVDSATGTMIKSGDATRALVGIGYVSGGSWTLCRSWFNDPGFVISAYIGSGVTIPFNTAWTDVTGCSVSFLSWSGESILLAASGAVYQSDTGQYQTGIRIDGSAQDVSFPQNGSTGAVNGFCLSLPISSLSEGYHTAIVSNKCNSATFNCIYQGSANTGERTTIRATSAKF